MAERVFVMKLRKAGFEDISMEQRTPFGIEQAPLYPLFTPEIINLMRELIPADRQQQLATCVIAKGHKPT